MIHLFILAVHLLATIVKLVRPGGVRAVVAESLVLKHQLLISSRARRRAPNLNSFDRFVLGLGSLFVPASRIPKLAVILKPPSHQRLGPNGRHCLHDRWKPPPIQLEEEQAIAVRELDPTAHLTLKHDHLTSERGILSLKLADRPERRNHQPQKEEEQRDHPSWPTLRDSFTRAPRKIPL